MSAAATLTNDHLFISGDLNFKTVVNLWNESLPLLAKRHECCIDLSQVTFANSAALTLLLEWLKYAQREKKSITFKNIPTKLLSIAAVIGVDAILPFSV